MALLQAKARAISVGVHYKSLGRESYTVGCLSKKSRYVDKIFGSIASSNSGDN
jgi:hypothetical protein